MKFTHNSYRITLSKFFMTVKNGHLVKTMGTSSGEKRGANQASASVEFWKGK
jgi:hypothetical protein